MELIQSKVVFEATAHTYTNEAGKTLSGVTSLMKKYLFAKLYADVPQAILDKAKDRGSATHANIQLLVEGILQAGTEPTIKCFEDACKDIHFVASEYLVSDNEVIASSIDLIDDQCNLYDVKTTSALNKEYLQWQLSIYAYLFELQNPDKKAGKLYAIHIHEDKCKVVEMTRLPQEYVLGLIQAQKDDVAPEAYTNPLHNNADATDQALLEQYVALASQIMDMQEIVKATTEQMDGIKAQLMENLTAKGVSKYDCDLCAVTIKAPSVRKSYDLKALQTKHPDFFKENEAVLNDGYKETQVKGSITIKIK